MPERILVTGSQGFIGAALVGRLLRERPRPRIVTLDRRPSESRGRHLRADLADPGAVRRAIRRIRPDIVFHLAGADKTRPWRVLWRYNVLSTYNLMEAVLSLPADRRPRVVLAGSALEYGPTRRVVPLTESSLPLPANAYGWSKLCQTQSALAYAGLGVHVTVARIFNVLGPGLPEHHAASAFCRQIALIEAGRARRLLVRGNLEESRDFIDVDDVLRALRSISRRGRPGEIYNVCSGRPVRIRSMLRTLVRLARSPVRIERTTAHGRRSGLSMQGSFHKLHRAVGWRPRTGLRESLDAMLGAWRTRVRRRP